MAIIETELKRVLDDLNEARQEVKAVSAKLDEFMRVINTNYVTRQELKQFEEKVRGTKWRDQLMTGAVATILATLLGYFIRDMIGR